VRRSWNKANTSFLGLIGRHISWCLSLSEVVRESYINPELLYVVAVVEIDLPETRVLHLLKARTPFIANGSRMRCCG